MQKVRILQSAFVSGELSPDLYGRVDHDVYSKAAEKIRNCYVLPQGGAKRREGLRKIYRIPNDAPGRLIDFQFNTEQTYLMLFTAGNMTVLKDDALAATVSSSPVSSITQDMLDDLNWTQSADTLLLFHGDLKTVKVTRSSDTDWAAERVTFTNIPNYDYGSGNEAVVSVARGWPKSGAFYSSRLYLCGLKSRPQTVLASKVGDYFNLDEGTEQDDEALNVTIDDDRVNAILQCFSGRSLQLFTTGGEFAIQGQLGDPITPSKIVTQLQKATLHGCNGARPQSVDGSTLFVEASGRAVRQFVYNDLEQTYNAEDISQLSPHLIVNPLRTAVRQATADYPADYVYMVNEDGTLSVLNIERSEDLVAWSLFTTDGLFEDVAVVGTDVYVIVNRFINGQTQRYIEKFDPDYKTDCAARQVAPLVAGPLPFVPSQGSQTDWSGFDYLNGATVSILGDDYVFDSQVVSNGTITVKRAVSRVEVGLPFYANVTPLPASVAFNGQYVAGKFRRMVSMGLLLRNSRGVVVYQSNGTERKCPWRQFGQAVLNAPVALFSGWKQFFLGGYDRDPVVDITQDDPLEFHLLGIQTEIGVA